MIIDGWRKQPKGYWYQSDTRSRVRLTSEGIVMEYGVGYCYSPIPVPVILDLLASSEEKKP